MWTWLVWALVLVMQSASATWASRARNGRSLGYHAWAFSCSDSLWYLSQVFMLDKVIDSARGQHWGAIIAIGAFYTVLRLIGSLAAHYVSMHFLEVGQRRIS